MNKQEALRSAERDLEWSEKTSLPPENVAALATRSIAYATLAIALNEDSAPEATSPPVRKTRLEFAYDDGYKDGFTAGCNYAKDQYET